MLTLTCKTFTEIETVASYIEHSAPTNDTKHEF